MQVKDLVNQYYNNLSSGSTVSKKTKGVEQLVSTVSDLQKGQVFEGTISSVKGSNVTLALSNGQTINARLDKGVDLSEGQSVFFQVKESDGNTVRISPVSIGGNMNNPTLTDALNSAGIPINERSLNLVNNMMQEAMPINAENLADMNRLLSAHPSADPKTIVSLVKNNLPVTDEMIEQYQNYKASEGAILESVDDITAGIQETFSSDNVTAKDSLAFLSKINDIFSGTVSMNDAPQIPADAVLSGEAVLEENVIKETGGNEAAAAEEKAPDFPKDGTTIVISLPESDIDSSLMPSLKAGNEAAPENITHDTAKNPENEVKAEDIIKNPLPADEAQRALSDKVSNEGAKTESVAKEEIRQYQGFIMPTDEEIENAPDTSLAKTVPKEVIKDLNTLIRNEGLSEHPAFKAIMNENGSIKYDANANDVFNAFLNAAKDEPELAKRLLKDNSFNGLLKGLMEKEWTLKPSELSKPGALKDFYAKLSTDMSLIGKHATDITGNPENMVTRSSTLIQNNVDFINNLNQAFPYVQIPIRLNGQNQTADLYVYTNKKKNPKEGDELSAFLHFDLEYLGSTDISVKMKGKNVDTQFFMEDDASYELIKNNLHILKDRLDKLGYNAKLSVENDSKPINLIEDVLEKDASTAGSLQRYSFDMRA